jgi:hypothetical protein
MRRFDLKSPAPTPKRKNRILGSINALAVLIQEL